MKLYPMFLLMATVTVFSPGPGVVMTLTNTLRYGLKRAMGGILGIATGAAVVACLSATGAGMLLTTSPVAFAMMKWLGAMYLIYLGMRLWRGPGFSFSERDCSNGGFMRFFAEGVSLQLTNPKAIFFFLSVLPQFIDLEASYTSQFSVLVVTYSVLVIVVHCLYGFCAYRAKSWLGSKHGGKAINRTGAVIFILFGVGLAIA